MTKEVLLASTAVGSLTPTSCQQTFVWDGIVDFSSALHYDAVCCIRILIAAKNTSTGMSILAYTDVLMYRKKYGRLWAAMFLGIYSAVMSFNVTDTGHVYYLCFLLVDIKRCHVC